MDDKLKSSSVPFDYGTHFGNIKALGELLRDGESSWITRMPADPQHHQYVVWLGCSITRTAHIADTLGDVLRYLGADFVALGGPSHCCGIRHNEAGDQKVAGNIIKQTLHKIDALTPSQMLNWCPSCNTELKVLPPETLTDTAKRRINVTGFIANQTEKLRFTKIVPMCVAVHSHGGTSDEDADGEAVRSILRRIPGLELVEAPPVTAYPHHCSDLNVRKQGKDVYIDNLKGWANAAKRQGASHIVTLYHSCHRQLLLSQMGLPNEQRIEVINYLTLVARGLGLKEREDTFARFARAGDIDAMMDELAPRITALGMDPARARKTLVAHFAQAVK